MASVKQRPMIAAAVVVLLLMIGLNNSGGPAVQEAPDTVRKRVASEASDESNEEPTPTPLPTSSSLQLTDARVPALINRVVLPYHQWFLNTLRSSFGFAISDAVYNPEMFNLLARDRGQKNIWKHRDEFVFATMKEPPRVPTHFHNISNVLWWNKQLTTVAISKLSRDSEMEALYARVAQDPNHLKLQLFERTIVRALSAQVQYFHTVLQLAVDTDVSDEMKRVLQQLASRHQGLDPLVLLSGWIGPGTSIHAINELFNSPATLLTNVVSQRAQEVQAANKRRAQATTAPSQALFPLRYDDVAYNRANPLNGKFWNMIRPTAGCSSVVRLCEVADGCRLFCNPEYFLHAGGAGGVAPYFHRFIGMGCNNDYEWENSVVSLFSGASAQSNSTTHRIGWFTAMDCSLTVGPGKRQWRVPEALQSAPIGFGAVSLCADGTKSGDNIITLPEVKAFQLKAETTWIDPTTSQPIARHAAHPDAIAAAKRNAGNDHHRITMVRRQSNTATVASSSPRLFDGVSILKMDIEGFEWNVIPKWLEDELRSIGNVVPSAVAVDSTTAINFEEAVPDYFSVSLLALEFHRVGHKQLYGAAAIGALRAHWLMLHIYALGFVLIGNEKNEMDQCCFEHAYVHVRHFVRSEMWMVLRDDL
ncbi:Hypothetical protein, putative [Bodo saltans]|uniref:Membrane-associated protein n=1 Tax=Bodo saltans TaxID=75058 RepID=A0A0S4J475_BODSA|nr:Hypothetical protein, putative [Bodo saltans]|eukprot:CUG44279.1 Hypothetical protein, putative [Bodo saltans]